MPKIIAERKGELALLLLIILVALVLRLNFLHEPFERDEGYYSTIAMEILHGGLPYRDAIDQKPPGVFYLYALAMSLFGQTPEGIRIFTAIYSICTLISVYWLARFMAGAMAGLAAGALFACIASAPMLQASSSNSEVFMLLPLTLSACFFVAGYERQQRKFLLLTGLFIGLTMLIKTVALPFVLLYCICALFYLKEERTAKGAALNLACLLAPPIGIALATMGYFYAMGCFDDFLYWNLTAGLKYSKGSSGVKGPTLGFALRYLKRELIFPAMLAVPAALVLPLARRNFSAVVAALLLPASCAAVLLPGMNFPHYFILLIPSLSLLGGIALAWVARSRGLLLWLSAPVVAVLFCYHVYADYPLYAVLTPERVSMLKYGKTFAQSVRVAQYLRERTEPGDYIFQWGFEPELYFLSGRRTPVPYISSTIIKNSDDPERATQAMIRALEEKRPRYVIIQPEWADWPGFEELKQFMAGKYYQEGQLEYAYLFRRVGN